MCRTTHTESKLSASDSALFRAGTWLGPCPLLHAYVDCCLQRCLKLGLQAWCLKLALDVYYTDGMLRPGHP